MMPIALLNEISVTTTPDIANFLYRLLDSVEVLQEENELNCKIIAENEDDIEVLQRKIERIQTTQNGINEYLTTTLSENVVKYRKLKKGIKTFMTKWIIDN